MAEASAFPPKPAEMGEVEKRALARQIVADINKKVSILVNILFSGGVCRDVARGCQEDKQIIVIICQ